MQVAERDVVRARREVRSFDAVLEDRVGIAFAAAELAAAHEPVQREEVHGVGPERVAQGGDEPPHAFGVETRRGGRVEFEELLGAHRESLRHERHEHEHDRRAVTGGEFDDAAVLRTGRVAEHGDAGRGEQRGPRVERGLVVVVAGDRDDLGARRAQREQRIPDHPLGVGERCRRLEQVAGDEHEVDGLGRRDARDLREHGPVLVEAGFAAQRLADVPVGGVQNLHDSPGRPA